MPDLFTANTGEACELPTACDRHHSALDDFLRNIDSTSIPIRVVEPPDPILISQDGTTDDPRERSTSVTDTSNLNRQTSCSTPSPLIKIVNEIEFQKATSTPTRLPNNPASHPLSKKGCRSGSIKSVANLVTVSMVYNEYGELVKEKDAQVSLKSDELSVTQLLRVIKKAYHHEVCILPHYP